GGINRDANFPESGLLKKWPDAGPTLLWHFDDLGDGHSSAAVTATTVYASGMIGDKGYVYALDHSGKLLWKTSYGTEWTQNWNGVRSTPLIYRDKIYIYSSFGILTCMDAKTGQIIWAIDTFKEYDGQSIQWGVTENLLSDDGKIYCTPGGIEANMIALKADDGKLIWKSKGNGEKSAYNSPCIILLKNKKIIVTMTEKSIVGIDASQGNVLWKVDYPTKYSIQANTPLYNNGFLYCMSGSGKGGLMFKVSEDGAAVKTVWRDTILDNTIGGFVNINNHIMAASDKRKSLECIDWDSGKELYSLNALTPGNVIASEGLLYVYSQAGMVALVEPK